MESFPGGLQFTAGDFEPEEMEHAAVLMAVGLITDTLIPLFYLSIRPSPENTFPVALYPPLPFASHPASAVLLYAPVLQAARAHR